METFNPAPLNRILNSYDFDSADFFADDWILPSNYTIPGEISALDLGKHPAATTDEITYQGITGFEWDPTSPPPVNPPSQTGNQFQLYIWGDPHIHAIASRNSYSEKIQFSAVATETGVNVKILGTTPVTISSSGVWFYLCDLTALNGKQMPTNISNAGQTFTVPVVLVGKGQTLAINGYLSSRAPSITLSDRFLFGDNNNTGTILFLYVRYYSGIEYMLYYDKVMFWNGVPVVKNFYAQKRELNGEVKKIPYSDVPFVKISYDTSPGYATVNLTQWDLLNANAPIQLWGGYVAGMAKYAYKNPKLGLINLGDGPTHPGLDILANGIGYPNNKWLMSTDVLSPDSLAKRTWIQAQSVPFNADEFLALCTFSDFGNESSTGGGFPPVNDPVFKPIGTSTSMKVYYYTTGAVVGQIYGSQTIYNPFPANVVSATITGTVDDDLVINGVNVENIGIQHHPNYTWTLAGASFTLAAKNMLGGQAKLDITITFTVIG